ncbi:MAG: twitching motility protein PilT, partial [Deltaproteobacteria bacterium]|nr:twitching motility protein PilT [Deltaproteobacteria bacterium]
MPNRVFDNTASFRFYEELNDFLPPDKRKKVFDYRFNGNPAIKDPIEALGVPRTEVDLIIVNGKSVGFDHTLKNADLVSVYPVFESIDISPILKLRETPLRKSAFILATHLGKLAKLLRLLGFDAEYSKEDVDTEIIRKSIQEKRIILTRDRQLLQRKEITHGVCIRSTDQELQVKEVLKRFDLYSQIKEFHR